MTALKKYQRLECQGLWRETPEAQRRDVNVSFREATLIISDGRSDTALSHWSLPAVARLNPGQMPAVYAPGEDAAETLELDDTLMIEALETVHDAIEAQSPHPGRMRNWLLAGALAAVLAAGVFWMPGALIAHTARVVPFATRQQIGLEVLADLSRITGTPCANAPARAPLAAMTARLFGPASGAVPGPVQVAVLRDSPVRAVDLPGRILVLDRHLIEDRDSPDVAAGYLLAENTRALLSDPLVPLLHWVGLRGTFELLTTGSLPAHWVMGYGEALLSRPQPKIPADRLLEAFRAAGVPASPYARAVDPGGKSTRTLIAGDPFADGPAPRPVLSDDEWVALQGICTE